MRIRPSQRIVDKRHDNHRFARQKVIRTSFKRNKLTLDRTVEICQTIELTRPHAKAIQQGTSYSNDYNVDAIRRNRKDFEQSSKQEMIMK